MGRSRVAKLPCAYCGRKDGTCHDGHVIPECMYPQSNKVVQIKVPECHVCKKYWEGYDARFRDMIVLSGEANELANEKFFGPICRSFDKPSGQKWLRELRESLVVTADNTGYKVYPLRDERVMRIMKRLVRGLSYWHGLGDCITEEQVFVDVFRFVIPPEFQTEFKRESLGDSFCWYEYADRRGKDDGTYHSAWVIEFYSRTRFFCLISASPSGWASDAA